MEHLKQLILSGAVAVLALAVLAPAASAADAGPAVDDSKPAPPAATSKKCHWDKKTGRMICQRPSR